MLVTWSAIGCRCCEYTSRGAEGVRKGCAVPKGCDTRQLPAATDDLLDPVRTSWAARTFSAYHSQRVSVAIHYSAAAEIVTGRRYAVAGIRHGMRQARAQRGGARRGRGGHTERTPAPALTLVNYPPLAATARADGGDATTTAGVAAGGDAAGAGAHARGGADDRAVA